MSYIDLKIMEVAPFLDHLAHQYLFAKSDGLYFTRIWASDQAVVGPFPTLPLNFPAATPLVLGAGGIVYPTQNYHTVDTYLAAATDDLNNMVLSGDLAGLNLLILRPENDARSIVVKHVTNGYINLKGGVDITLDDVTDHILLFYNGWTWVNITG